jgi:hypothetical protein
VTNDAPPQLSPDGHWWWTGRQWVPAPPQPPAPAPALELEPTAALPLAPLPVNAAREILPSTYVPAPRSGPGALKTALIGGAAAVVLLGGGATVAVGHYLGGGGQQPEDVLPASAVGVVKVDLDPSLGQKKALYDLSRKFPRVHAKGTGSIKDDLLGAMLSGSSMSYDRDVKPWLGDRVAVAAVPDGSPDGFAPVAAVQYTDKGKATKTLRLAALRATSDNTFAFAFSGDYVVIATTQADADRYARTTTHLSDNSTYKSAVAALDGDQIAVAWADLGGLYNAIPKAQLKANPLLAGTRTNAHPTGSMVVGAHASSGYLEVQGKGVNAGDSLGQLGGATLGKGRIGNLIGSFPNDTAAAFEVAGLGPALAAMYASSPPLKGVAATASTFGFQLPGDIATVLGTDTAIGMTGGAASPSFVARVRTASPDRAVAVLSRVAKAGKAPPFAVRKEAGGFVLATDPADLAAVTTGRLGTTASFQRALPDAKAAAMAVYVSFARLPLPQTKDVENLDAFGMTVDPSTGAFRLRLTVR